MRFQEPGANNAGAQPTVGVGDEQEPILLRAANEEKPRFIGRMIRVKKRNRVQICKRRCRFRKRDPVFGTIMCRFARIPFKLHRVQYSTMLRALSNSRRAAPLLAQMRPRRLHRPRSDATPLPVWSHPWQPRQRWPRSWDSCVGTRGLTVASAARWICSAAAEATRYLATNSQQNARSSYGVAGQAPPGAPSLVVASDQRASLCSRSG